MARYAPAGVVVDEEMQIVQFRGKTGPTSSRHRATLACTSSRWPEGLVLGIRAAIDASMNSGAMARREQIKVRQDEKIRYVDVEVWPLKVRLPQGAASSSPSPSRAPRGWTGRAATRPRATPRRIWRSSSSAGSS